jgi:thiol peroxidase
MATTKFKGQPVKVIGEFIKVGAVAPDFELVKTDLSSFSLKELNGKNVILNIFPSLDTGVCATSVRKFNKLAAGYGSIGYFKRPAFCTCPFLHHRRY